MQGYRNGSQSLSDWLPFPNYLNTSGKYTLYWFCVPGQ